MLKHILLTIVAVLSLNAQEVPRTFALVVGISQYEHLPKDLWLQYPRMDAQAIGRHLASPRGGGIPADQMLILTDQQATTAAIRDAFRTFLKTRPGKNDTVYVLMAGHGTVDNSGAYILTWDSDPENLAQTALPMAELHSTVEEALSKVGRIILLADVCRAASIAGTKTAELGDAVAGIGEAPGELLGLMAARPREVSFEGPEFGGGHGAFTWSVLQGLEGAADSNHDGFVTAGELIDYVTAEVPGATRNKQHPRDFGNMENETRLSDLSKPGIEIR